MSLSPSHYCFGATCCYLDNCKVSLMPVKWKDFKLYCLFHLFTLDQLCWWNVIADLPSCVRTFWRRTRCPPLCLQSICCLPCWRYRMIPSPMYVWHWPESWLSALFLSVSGALQILKQMEFSLRSYGVILEKRGLCASLGRQTCVSRRGSSSHLLRPDKLCPLSDVPQQTVHQLVYYKSVHRPTGL